MPGQLDQSAKRPAPPYVAYPTFKTMIAGFGEHVIPNRIDRSVLGNFSGIVGSQLLTALRFLDLIDDERHPRPSLEALVADANTDAWPVALSKILRQAYEPIFDLDLKSASPSQFTERFRQAYPVEGTTLRKCLTFFLAAVADSQIAVSPYIMKNKKPRSAPARKRPARAGEIHRASGGVGQEAAIIPTARPVAPGKSMSEMLLEHFNPKEMNDEQQAAVWTLLRYFKALEV
jgi:hypothetical protein